MPEYRPEWVATSDRRLGERLRMIRVRLDLSQRDVAQAVTDRHGLGWHQTTVAKVEAGDRPVRVAEALAVADVLGVHVDELLDQPADSSEARQHQATRLHARLHELERLQGDIGRRHRQLKRVLDHDEAGGDDRDEHPAAT